MCGVSVRDLFCVRKQFSYRTAYSDYPMNSFPIEFSRTIIGFRRCILNNREQSKYLKKFLPVLLGGTLRTA